jgi:type I restriction enzyme S subunit
VADPVEEPFKVPDGWEWTQIDDCFLVTGGIQKSGKRRPAGNSFPYLRVANVQRGRLDLAEIAEFELFNGELERYQLEPGDLLVVEGNGSESEIGRCARWSGEIDHCVHQNHLIRCRPLDNDLEAFTLLYLNSSIGTAVMRRLAVTTSGLYNLSVGKIRAISMPLPPREEQQRIASRVWELMSLCDSLERALAKKSQAGEALAGTTRILVSS